MPATPTTHVPFGVIDSMVSATVGTWTSVTRASLDYWSGALHRRATPLDLGQDLLTWMGTVADRERPRWAHEHRVVKEWPLARLRDFSAPDADPGMVATVVLPPQAGHDSSIVDFAPDQSQVMTARANGCHRVFSLDWVGATAETRDAGIDDYVALLRETVELLGGRVNLVGDCQGGWLATIFTALHPELVNSLAIAGAPIDFHAGEPLIHDWVKVLTPGGDLSLYRAVVEANDGLLPGRFLLDGFIALQPDQEVDRQLQLLAHLHEPAAVERYRRFENWFKWTQPLPGAFYLWVVEHLFAGNELIRGELVVEGRTVHLADITCPLFLMAGETDHITPAPQVWALAEHASTPADKVGRQSSSGGHLGLFMSHEALERHWSIIFAEMAALSTPTEQEPATLTDEPTGSGEFEVPAQPAARPVRARRVTAKRAAPEKAVAPKPDVAPKPKPRTEATPKPKTEATPKPAVATRKQAAAKAVAPKPDVAPKPRTEATPKPKTEATPKPAVVTRKQAAAKAVAPKPDVAPKPRTEATPKPKTEATPKPAVATRKAAAPKAAAPKSDVAPTPKTATQQKVAARKRPAAPKKDAVPKTEATPEPTATPKTVAESITDTSPKPAVTPKTVAEAITDTSPKPDADPGSAGA